jgi:hypothetical protein
VRAGIFPVHLDGGVANQDVQATVMVDRSVHHGLHVLWLGDVAANEDCFTTYVPDRGGCRLASTGVNLRDHNASAFARKQLRYCSSDPSAPTSDHSHLVL